MTDVFRYMIKMRAYLIEGKYYSVVAIGELLRKILQDGHRVIDLCELNYYILIISRNVEKISQVLRKLNVKCYS